MARRCRTGAGGLTLRSERPDAGGKLTPCRLRLDSGQGLMVDLRQGTYLARIPQAWLAEINDGKIVEIATETLFAGRRAVMIGVPGAFTPICTEKHLPDFVAGAEKLTAAGYDTIVCLAANDPWTVRSWADAADPLRKIRFLSDGNLDFSRKLGLTEVRRDLYLGERTSRFLMILENAVIQRLAVEPFVEHLTRTRCDDVFL